MPRRTMNRPEEALHRAVAQYLVLIESGCGFFWFHPANGGARSKAEAGIMKALGVKAGTPDIAIVHRGRALFIELKAPKGRVSPAQKKTIPAIEAAGAPCAICRSLDDVQANLKTWGILQ